MRAVALIPARGGSKRLPRKNVRLFAGRPLLSYSIAAAYAAAGIDRCVVSTEDEEVARIARDYGAEVIDRPPTLSTDTASSASVVEHALQTWRQEGALPDAVVLLQPNCPLRPASVIANALALLAEGGSDSVISVSEHHLKVGTIEGRLFRPEYGPGTRSQDMPRRYFENGVVYATWPAVVLEQRSVFGERIRPLVVDPLFALGDIDTAFDFSLAEWLFATHPGQFGWLETAAAERARRRHAG